MRIQSILSAAVLLLAACGASESDPANQQAADSAAVEAIVEDPSAPATADQGVIGNVNQRLDQAEKDEAARTAEGMEQVRQAEGAPTP
jgi:hypothetical protein